MSLNGVAEFVQNLGEVQKYRKDIIIDHIVPTFLDGRVNQSEEILEQLQTHFGEIVREPIPVNVRLAESFAHGQTIYEYAPECAGAKMYEKLVRTVDEYAGR